MRYSHIKSSTIKEKNHGAISVKNIIQNRDSSVSIAEVKLDGINKKSRNLLSDSYYYVVEGEGKFTFGEAEIHVEKGDFIFIPKGTYYFDSGRMKLLAINSPAFSADNVQFLA